MLTSAVRAIQRLPVQGNLLDKDKTSIEDANFPSNRGMFITEVKGHYRRVLAVVNVDSPDTLDQILFDLPIMKEHGQHVQIDVTPLRRYEDFATDVKKRLE